MSHAFEELCRWHSASDAVIGVSFGKPIQLLAQNFRNLNLAESDSEMGVICFGCRKLVLEM